MIYETDRIWCTPSFVLRFAPLTTDNGHHIAVGGLSKNFNVLCPLARVCWIGRAIKKVGSHNTRFLIAKTIAQDWAIVATRVLYLDSPRLRTRVLCWVLPLKRLRTQDKTIHNTWMDCILTIQILK